MIKLIVKSVFSDCITTKFFNSIKDVIDFLKICNVYNNKNYKCFINL